MDLIQFPKILDARGNLTFVERLPFAIKRCYWLYHVPDGSLRGGHAHRTLDRVFIAVAGRFKLNGIELSNPWEGLRVLPMTWVELTDFSNGAVCLVLASAQYDESDYIRDRVEFNRLTQISA
jgi:hypothetical protein